jgi:hypothetical protein
MRYSSKFDPQLLDPLVLSFGNRDRPTAEKVAHRMSRNMAGSESRGYTAVAMRLFAERISQDGIHQFANF